MNFHFDKSERFIGHVQKEWERRKRIRTDVVSRIATIAPVDHREVLPIQAADFMAWHTNRSLYNNNSSGAAYLISWFALPSIRQHVGYDQLIKSAELELVGRDDA